VCRRKLLQYVLDTDAWFVDSERPGLADVSTGTTRGDSRELTVSPDCDWLGYRIYRFMFARLSDFTGLFCTSCTSLIRRSVAVSCLVSVEAVFAVARSDSDRIDDDPDPDCGGGRWCFSFPMSSTFSLRVLNFSRSISRESVKILTYSRSYKFSASSASCVLLFLAACSSASYRIASRYRISYYVFTKFACSTSSYI
jgi:hypothetical protein